MDIFDTTNMFNRRNMMIFAGIIVVILLIYIWLTTKESYKSVDWKNQLQEQGVLNYMIKHNPSENFGPDWTTELKNKGIFQFMVEEGYTENATDKSTNSVGLKNNGIDVVFTPIKSTMPILKQNGSSIYIPNSYTYADRTTNMDTLYTLPADEKKLESDESYSNTHLTRVRNRIDAFNSYKPRTVADSRSMMSQENEKDYS